ncbi:hypothetical protein JCM10213_009034 [Rhodosporidiobolus nylandii]
MTQPAIAAVVSRDGGEGEGEREDAGEVKAVSPFERLPDELLLALLEEVDAIMPLHYPSNLASVAADKRIYRCARTVAFRCIVTDLDNQSRLLPNLYSRPDLPPLVRHLSFGYHASTFLYDCNLLPLLRNLTSLALYKLDPESGVLSSLFSDALRRLSHLECLSLRRSAAFSWEDATFRPSKDMPQLRTLAFDDCLWPSEGCQQLLDDPQSRIEVFEWTGDTQDSALYNFIPWSGLRRLALKTSSRLPPRLLPLTSLQLGGMILDSAKNNDLSGGFTLRHLDALLSLLDKSKLRHIHLFLPLEAVFPVFTPSTTFTGMRSLVLNGWGVSRIKPQDIPGLCSLLSTFPDVQHLRLQSVALPSSSAAPLDHDSATEVALVVHYPVLAAILHYLRHSTKVLELVWPVIISSSLRWTRGSPAEEFKLERYRR